MPESRRHSRDGPAWLLDRIELALRFHRFFHTLVFFHWHSLDPGHRALALIEITTEELFFHRRASRYHARSLRGNLRDGVFFGSRAERHADVFVNGLRSLLSSG